LAPGIKEPLHTTAQISETKGAWWLNGKFGALRPEGGSTVHDWNKCSD